MWKCNIFFDPHAHASRATRVCHSLPPEGAAPALRRLGGGRTASNFSPLQHKAPCMGRFFFRAIADAPCRGTGGGDGGNVTGQMIICPYGSWCNRRFPRPRRFGHAATGGFCARGVSVSHRRVGNLLPTLTKIRMKPRGRRSDAPSPRRRTPFHPSAHPTSPHPFPPDRARGWGRAAGDGTGEKVRATKTKKPRGARPVACSRL